ncbi:hypothetical protein GE09DRAFT_945687 [Coniochaeta sp. 2T2.1]|nr:hypothetical protein GE09DRAFT_945687 [Coniochaeta sp. 2T2.1]
MSIPNSRNDDEPPPPLPPPRFVPIDGPTAYDLPPSFDPRARDHDHDFFPEDRESFRESYKSRDRSYRPELDEGYHSISSSARSVYRPASPQFRMHNGYQFRPRADADNSMIDKLNARRFADNRSPIQFSATSPSALSSSERDHINRRTPMQLPKLLSLPDRTRLNQPMLDSPHRYSQTPLSSAVSPRCHPLKYGNGYMGDHRSPLSADSGGYDMVLYQPEYPRPRRRNSGSVPDDTSTHSYEMRDDDMEFPMDETSRLDHLHINDAYRERERDRGQKRRASSPPEDALGPPLASDMFRRRDISGLSRGSPTPRLTPIPQSSVSSISSNGGRSAASYVSTSTAATSIGSYDRRSPNGPSPISPESYEPGSPYAASIGGLSRRSSNSRGPPLQQPHQRTLSGLSAAAQEVRAVASPRKLSEPIKPNSLLSAKMQGFFMCDCCPKKPKKFETAEELRAHEAEKQYSCSYCNNRFKNKNEAERHQNSLHLRRHSWSCSALTAFEHAFHASTSAPGEADTCGYCGDEFPRSGPPIPAGQGQGHGKFITDADWEIRVRHLQDVHKFRECNAGKKFFRADHFRQHLKHSHAGTSGKWTNMLENACMSEEEPPVPVR